MENPKRQFVLNLLTYAVQRNVSAEQLCRVANIDLNALRRQPALSVTTDQLDALWRNASLLSGDDLFGLHLGEASQVTALGIVGEIVRTSTTVGEALTYATSLAHLISHALRMDITPGSRTFTIRFIPVTDEPPTDQVAFRQVMDFFMAFTVHESDSILLKKINPVHVQIPYQDQMSPEYQRVLRCQPTASDDYVLEWDKTYWNEPILTADYSLQRLLLQKISVTNKQMIGVTTLQTMIYDYLLANSYLGIVPLGHVAANFNISPRNLQRRLMHEGVTYQQVADKARQTLALHYLMHSNCPIKDVSISLGYNEPSAFTRAFKRWTGRTPLDYQAWAKHQKAGV